MAPKHSVLHVVHGIAWCKTGLSSCRAVLLALFALLKFCSEPPLVNLRGV